MSHQTLPIIGPFEGYVDNLPIPHSSPKAFDTIINWMCRKGRVHLRPKVQLWSGQPDNAIIRHIRTFRDIQNNQHTLVLTTKTAYYITTSVDPGIPTWHALTLPGGLTTLSGTALPYGVVGAEHRVYFSNGSTKILYTDGEASVKSAGYGGAARFLTVNASHLIGAYITAPEPGAAGSTVFPNRVIWSAVGNLTNWTDFSSGEADLVESSDEITGLATLGQRTFVWRTNGITIMTPTGIGEAPFRFDNLSLADTGIGTQYPYAIAVYNDRAVFVADSDIYIASPSDLQSIGAKAKKAIFADLARVAGDEVQGFVVTKLGPSVDYLSYWLSIPGVSTWIYSMDDEAWQRFDSFLGRITSLSYATLTV